MSAHNVTRLKKALRVEIKHAERFIQYRLLLNRKVLAEEVHHRSIAAAPYMQCIHDFNGGTYLITATTEDIYVMSLDGSEEVPF